MAKRQTARTWVGREVRRAREATTPRTTRPAVAERLSISPELVAAWESGRLALPMDHAENLVKVLDFGPSGEMLLRVVASLVNGEAAPEFEGKWVAAEQAATAFWSFESGVVPGLLQTADYARGVLPSEEHVSRRIERQKILSSAGAPLFTAVMGEAVLRLAVGGPAVMAEQLAVLADHAERENVFVHVVPMTAPVSGQFTGPFMVATLDDGRSLAYGATVIGSGEVYESPEDVAEIRTKFERFRAHALPRRESVELIRRTVDQWTT